MSFLVRNIATAVFIEVGSMCLSESLCKRISNSQRQADHFMVVASLFSAFTFLTARTLTDPLPLLEGHDWVLVKIGGEVAAELLIGGTAIIGGMVAMDTLLPNLAPAAD